jgi:hypothetical protein
MASLSVRVGGPRGRGLGLCIAVVNEMASYPIHPWKKKRDSAEKESNSTGSSAFCDRDAKMDDKKHIKIKNY